MTFEKLVGVRNELFHIGDDRPILFPLVVLRQINPRPLGRLNLAGWKRRPPIWGQAMKMRLRLVLVGFLCALSGTTLGTVAEFFAFGSGKSGAAMQAALPLAWGILALIIGLVPGLSLAAPLLPRVTTHGLRTPQGLTLAGAILAVQLLAGLAAGNWEPSGFATIGFPGLVSAAIALLAFDAISANRRGAGITRVVVTGFVCGALVGPAICFRFASALLDSVYPQTLPGVWQLGEGQFILLSCIATGGALLIGLCLVAPLLRGIATQGLRGPRGRLLVLAILAGQPAIVVSLLPGSLQATTDRLLLAAATALPAATSGILALILFHFLLIFLAPKAASGGRGKGLADKSPAARKFESSLGSPLCISAAMKVCSSPTAAPRP